MVEVDKNQDNDCRKERQQDEGLQLEANNGVRRPKDDGGQHLNGRVLPGNGFFAETALATQQQIADNRDIVIRFDRLAAFRTVRVRKHNRFLRWEPGYADIQKTTDDQAEKDKEKVRQKYCDLDWHDF